MLLKRVTSRAEDQEKDKKRYTATRAWLCSCAKTTPSDEECLYHT